MSKKEPVRGDDKTHYARNMARENSSICSHRFKDEGKGDSAVTFCADCGKSLFRLAQKR